MLNIVIPMAGAGSRFACAGYKDPKPLIPIHKVPMIRIVVDNLTPTSPHRFIFICQASHVAEYDLARQLLKWAPSCEIIELNGVTDGAARTVLAAKELINSEDALMIANSDQYVDISIDNYLTDLTKYRLDGLIMTMKANDVKWSFVGLDSAGFVTRVVEKEAISNEATVGVYNFARGRDFVRGAELMIEKNLRVNGEFYVAPVYNELIAQGHRIGIHNIGRDGEGMYGLGVPGDLTKFTMLPLSLTAARAIK